MMNMILVGLYASPFAAGPSFMSCTGDKLVKWYSFETISLTDDLKAVTMRLWLSCDSQRLGNVFMTAGFCRGRYLLRCLMTSLCRTVSLCLLFWHSQPRHKLATSPVCFSVSWDRLQPPLRPCVQISKIMDVFTVFRLFCWDVDNSGVWCNV